MGLLVSVYRSPGLDCTNGGVSSTADTLCIVNIDGPFEPSDTHPAARLIRSGGIARIIPEQPGEGVGPMFGGHFAATSDSRFSRAVGFYGAVPIHDRWESAELNRAMST